MQQFISHLGKAVSVQLSELNNHSLTLNKWLRNAARRVRISELYSLLSTSCLAH
ncbi:hypothetical protein AALB_0661 [Agarivorans albus MKT 106]|uniref:Uncharacterized protein n=1 Tax=Agarivorans albus MKT 106 TaxID=1331007 RepID=R9PR34_AGAAL|nr:hypothetical protein AALB_0661 [Agarivorans albus MKT 106]